MNQETVIMYRPVGPGELALIGEHPRRNIDGATTVTIAGELLMELRAEWQ